MIGIGIIHFLGSDNMSMKELRKLIETIGGWYLWIGFVAFWFLLIGEEMFAASAFFKALVWPITAMAYAIPA